MFKRVLIANRGEIAIRVARAASALGVQSVSVYAPADTLSLHIRVTTESREIGSSRGPCIESARGPIGPLNRFQMEEMIDPRDTRRWVCEWVENAYRIVTQPALLVPRALQFRP